MIILFFISMHTNANFSRIIHKERKGLLDI